MGATIGAVLVLGHGGEAVGDRSVVAEPVVHHVPEEPVPRRLVERRATFMALRDQLGRVGPHCRSRMSVPFDTTTVQEDAQAVVAEALEAVPAALDLLDEQVHRLGRPVRSNRQVHLIPTT